MADALSNSLIDQLTNHRFKEPYIRHAQLAVYAPERFHRAVRILYFPTNPGLVGAASLEGVPGDSPQPVQHQIWELDALVSDAADAFGSATEKNLAVPEFSSDAQLGGIARAITDISDKLERMLSSQSIRESIARLQAQSTMINPELALGLEKAAASLAVLQERTEDLLRLQTAANDLARLCDEARKLESPFSKFLATVQNSASSAPCASSSMAAR